jgi:autotransporter-associated beta strand protein
MISIRCFFSLRVCLTAIAVLGCLSGRSSAQISGTWQRTGGIDGSWNNAGNWVGAKPTSGNATVLLFGAASATTIVNQDLGTPFTLNRLTFSNIAGAGIGAYTFTGGALRFEGDTAAINSLSGSSTQTIYNRLIIGSSNGLQISMAGSSSLVFYGDISNSHNGAAVLTLSGSSTVRPGLLQGQISDGSGTVSLLKGQSSSYYLANVNNNFSGNVTVAVGTLYVASVSDIGQAGALGQGVAVFLGGTSDGTLSLSSGGSSGFSTNRQFFLNSNAGSSGVLANDSANPAATFTLSGGVVSTSVGSFRTLVLNGSNAGANAVYSSIINGGSGGQIGVAKRGSGLWVLGGNNSYSGGTSIYSGALRVTDFAANVGAGHTRFLASVGVQGVLEASGTLTVSLGTQAGRVAWGASGGFAASTADLTLRLNNGTAPLVWNSGSFVVDGQELQLGSATSQGTVTLENPINLADNLRSIRVFDGAADVDAVITGSLFTATPALASLNKGGSGTLRLVADAAYSGTTTIAGTLILGNNGATGNLAGPVYTAAGGVLAFNRNDSLTFTSPISGSGGVRVLTGTVNLSGANTFTGGTTIHAGATLRIRGTSWPVAGEMNVAGGTLTFTDTASRSVQQATVTASGTINVFNSAVTITRLDLGNGSLNVQTANAAVQTLSLGSGGTVTISTGRTLTALTNRYGGPEDLTNVPQIQFSGSGSTGALITGPGALVLSGTQVWLQVDDAAAAFDLTIEAAITKSGTSGISKYGAGALYLPTAQPGLKNELALINGTIVIGNDRSLGDATLRFATNAARPELASAMTAALRTDGLAAYTLTNDIALGNSRQYAPLIVGGGNLTLSGAVTNYDDDQTLLLSLDAGKTLTLNRLVLSNDASAKHLTVGGTGMSVIRQIDGGSTATVASSLTFNGTGTVLLTGANNYRGATTIESGTVRLASGGAINSTAGITVAAGGMFVVDAGATIASAVTATGRYVLNGTLAGATTVADGGTLGGSGRIDGLLSGAGTVGPGNSPGILDVDQVDPTGGLDFLFEFASANAAPNYLNRTASGNDVLHVTDATSPFLAALTSGNTITIDFQIAPDALHDGDFFLGGFFTNLIGTDFTSLIAAADFQFLVDGNPLDTGVWQIGIDTVAQPSVDFGSNYGGEVDGRVMRLQVQQVQAVPEPSSMILCSLAAGGYFWRRRKKVQRDGVAT